MNSTTDVFSGEGQNPNQQQPRGRRRWILSLIGFVLLFLSLPLARAQTTAQLTGTVQDSSGAALPGAQVTLIDEATGLSHTVQSNRQGLFAFPALTPGTYTVKAEAKNFAPKELTGIVLHAGEERAAPPLSLTVGSESTTVTVEAANQMISTDDGARISVLDSKQIENLVLIGRDTTELLKILPGATTVSSSLSNNSPTFSDVNITVNNSAVGNGININGAVNRGGTALLADGANIIDPGNMASSVSIVNPEMVAEVSVQASNFSADTPFGPVVISTISKSGTDRYHGEAYFDARNSVLNANDWSDNHTKVAQGPQHYYYPGGNFGGPVPFTHKKLFFWAGYEKWIQNQGNSNVLKSFIPTPEMMAGDFTTDNADNLALCPNGFFANTTPGYPSGPWCNDLSGTIFPDGTPSSSALAAYGNKGGDVGQKIPAQFIDPGAAALAKIWPKANADPGLVGAGGYNYIQPIPNENDGWLYRFRIDYQWGPNTKVYGSYQQAFNSDLAQGNGAHLYWTPGNAIPYPGGGEQQSFFGKSLAGHFVHSFGASATNDLMAAWAFGSFPFVEPNPAAASRSTLGYTYGKVFPTTSVNIPAYNSAGSYSFPDFSQASIFENPVGKYAVKKEAPQFSDTFTKVWGTHTVKMGAFTQTTDNYQSTFSTNQDGLLSLGAGQKQNFFTGSNMGSNNAVANFTMGVASSYSENNSSPIADTAYQATAGFVSDNWKASRHLTLDLGVRIEHIGHWYDRQGIGMAVFYPDRVLADYNDGKYAPGYYWHAIDAGVPLSGQPNRFAYVDPRLGLAYDLRGNGNTMIRGGWGAYRFVTQVNDVGAPLVTAQHVLGYSLPGNNNILLSQLSKLAFKGCTTQCASGIGQSGFDPKDYGQPLTFAYNLTIDQRLKWGAVLDIAYVGSNTHQLSDNSEGTEGSNFTALADQNKTPVGAFFKPDPKTGVQSTNPQNLGTNPNLGNFTGTATGNVAADYHPYGYAYGTNTVIMNESSAYTNYNGLQVAFIKNTGKLGYNLNATWSKTLATSLQEDPFNIRNNYGPTAIDRPFVFNGSYYYQTGRLHTSNGFTNQVLGGWTISGISTWQAGGYIPAALGNGVPNFNLGIAYTQATLPGTGTPQQIAAQQQAMGLGNGIGAPTYFGTDAPIPILPVLTCDPTQGLKHYQRVNGTCFAAPAVGTQGGQKYPYMGAGAFFNNDLAIYRSFRIPGREAQQIQFRASAFNWLNHPIPGYDGNLTNLKLNYLVNYNSKAITTNFDTTNFGVMNSKTSAPYQRIIELNVKYFF
jgi:Carboxypeptidase regulatory-like domain